jgi:predicted alpha-1,2-mannosidase
MLAFYDQHGLLPIWELYANETGTMIGYSAVPVIVDAYFKGFRDYDVEEAYEAMKKSATQQNESVKMFNKYGYVPSDKASESVSKTLLYSFDDWCIAQMAKALGKKDDYQTYSKKAKGYKKLFNKKNGFMQPKLANGQWMEPFDPYAEPSNGGKRNYTEANAWQDIWYVPQNVQKLISMMGGRQSFVERLDTLFTRPPKIHGGGVPDISGLIGQYVQGNEPDMQVPFMYDYAGAPWKTQSVTRLIVDSLYNDTAAGLPGNEDCGQMSAWYVFSALGFYPVNPDNGIFMIGSPIFHKATIHLKGDKAFTVIAHNVSKQHKYIQSAKLNGKTYNKPYITYKNIIQGGTLEFQMGPKPNKQWGASSKSVPPMTAFSY